MGCEAGVKTPDSQGSYFEYLELLKLYDKNSNGTMMLAELDNLLRNLGDEIPKADVTKLFADLCEPEDEDGMFPYTNSELWRRLLGEHLHGKAVAVDPDRQ